MKSDLGEVMFFCAPLPLIFSFFSLLPNVTPAINTCFTSSCLTSFEHLPLFGDSPFIMSNVEFFASWLLTLALCCCCLVTQSVHLFATPWTRSPPAPLSMGFLKQEYWSVLPFPPPGDLPNPGIKPASLVFPVLAGGFFTTSANLWVLAASERTWILSITLHGSLDLGKESGLHIRHSMIFFSFGKWDRRLLFSYRRMKNLQSWTGRMVLLQEACRRQVTFSQLLNQPQGVTHLLCLLYNTSECLPLAKT